MSDQVFSDHKISIQYWIDYDSCLVTFLDLWKIWTEMDRPADGETIEHFTEYSGFFLTRTVFNGSRFVYYNPRSQSGYPQTGPDAVSTDGPVRIEIFNIVLALEFLFSRY